MNKKQRKVCIFCEGKEGQKISGEHLFSEWMHPILNIGTQNTYTKIDGRPIRLSDGRMAMDVRGRPRNEQTTSLKFRVVCDRCNGGWMSNFIETPAAEALTRIIQNERHTISLEDQRRIVEWVITKLMIVDASYAPYLSFKPDDFTRFKSSRTIPYGLQLYMGPYTGTEWQLSFLRNGMPIVVSSEPDGKSETVHPFAHFAVSFKTTMFFAVYTTIDIGTLGLWQNENPFGGRVVRLWPTINQPIHWPPEGALTDADFNKFIFSVFDYLHSRIGMRPRRTRIPLAVGTPVAGDTTLAPIKCIMFGSKNDEFIDLACGKCDFLISEGVSLETLRDTLEVPQRLFVRCPECGSSNRIPVRQANIQGGAKG